MIRYAMLYPTGPDALKKGSWEGERKADDVLVCWLGVGMMDVGRMSLRRKGRGRAEWNLNYASL